MSLTRRQIDFFKNSDLISRNEEFSLRINTLTATGKISFHFVHRSGRCVETDDLGAAIWEHLPATVEDIISLTASFLAGNKKQEENDKRSKKKNENKSKSENKNIVQGFNRQENSGQSHALEEPIEFSRRLIQAFLYVLYKAGIILRNGYSGLEEATEKKKVNLPAEGLFQTQQELSKELHTREGNALSVSTIVVTYNGERFIGRCLGSLRRQTWKPHEIIVVDNASTDGTIEIIKNQFPEVKLYRFSKNRHFARAVNFGIKKAEGKAFLILNQDVELSDDCVEHLALRLMAGGKKGQVAAVVPLIKFSDLRGFVNGLGNHIRPWGWGSDNFIGAVDVGQFESIEDLPSACFAAVLISKKAIDEVGDLDERYGSFYEDVDWSFRVWLTGWKIIACPQAVVFHHFGGSYEELRKVRFIVRNRLRFTLKIISGRRKLRYFYNYGNEDVRAIFSFLRQKKGKYLLAYILAYLGFIANIPEILIKRRRLKKKWVEGKKEAEIFALIPERWSLLNNNGEPIINRDMIKNYYLKYLAVSNA